jgi:hypothetical protein
LQGNREYTDCKWLVVNGLLAPPSSRKRIDNSANGTKREFPAKWMTICEIFFPTKKIGIWKIFVAFF